jgi:hypothetical protein
MGSSCALPSFLPAPSSPQITANLCTKRNCCSITPPSLLAPSPPQLDTMVSTDPAFDMAVRGAVEAMLAHVAEEEGTLLPRMGDALTPVTLLQLGLQFEAAKVGAAGLSFGIVELWGVAGCLILMFGRHAFALCSLKCRADSGFRRWQRAFKCERRIVWGLAGCFVEPNTGCWRRTWYVQYRWPSGLDGSKPLAAKRPDLQMPPPPSPLRYTRCAPPRGLTPRPQTCRPSTRLPWRPQSRVSRAFAPRRRLRPAPAPHLPNPTCGCQHAP